MKFPEKLKSRKLWIALVTAIGLWLNGNQKEAVYVILAYLGVQGATDVAKAINGKKSGGAM